MPHWSTKLPRLVFLTALYGCVMLGCSSEPSFRRGSAGESCRARNDCASGLACVNDVCVVGSSDLSVTGRGCYRVECETAADCCADSVPGPDTILESGDRIRVVAHRDNLESISKYFGDSIRSISETDYFLSLSLGVVLHDSLVHPGVCRSHFPYFLKGALG